jgi:hypothetical protein
MLAKRLFPLFVATKCKSVVNDLSANRSFRAKTQPRKKHMSNPFLTPGAFVINRSQLAWGLGQIQSAIGSKVTVNFEQVGKLVLNTDHVTLDVVDAEDNSWRSPDA